MDMLSALLDPRLLTLLVVAIAISYLVGEINGEHPAEGSTDSDANAAPPAAVEASLPADKTTR
jgi:hypothetical protein